VAWQGAEGYRRYDGGRHDETKLQSTCGGDGRHKDDKGRHGNGWHGETMTARGGMAAQQQQGDYSRTKVTKIGKWLRLACGVHRLMAATATEEGCFAGDGGGASKMAKVGRRSTATADARDNVTTKTKTAKAATTVDGGGRRRVADYHHPFYPCHLSDCDGGRLWCGQGQWRRFIVVAGPGRQTTMAVDNNFGSLVVLGEYCRGD
jgi:hypothetical protein